MIPKEVFEETLLQFLEPIRPFLDDASVSEIMINGPDQIFIERKGRLELTGVSFPSRNALEAAMRNCAQYVGKHVDKDRPILEGRLPDGSRIEAVFPPVAPDGPSVSIRRFFKETLTVKRLIGFGALTDEAAQALEAIVASKLNTLVAGGTGSGKTSMLNALSSYIPEGERVVVIEDSRELQLQRAHVVQLESRPPDPKGRYAVSIRDLFRATLRMRPDRIVVGEIRGGEALDLIQAMTSGHGGCLSTLHATYPRDTLSRMETMAMMSEVRLAEKAVRAQIAAAVHVIVQVARQSDGTRRITHITELTGAFSDVVSMQDIFLFEKKGLGPNGKVKGRFFATGVVPKFAEKLIAAGMPLPAGILDHSVDI